VLSLKGKAIASMVSHSKHATNAYAPS
jgi:hypothetical protein